MVLAALAPADATSSAVVLQDAISHLAESGCSGVLPILERLSSDSSGDTTVARALLYKGFCQERLDRSAAVKTYKQVIAAFREDSEVVSAARSRIAKLGFTARVDVKATGILRYINSIALRTKGFDIIATGDDTVAVTPELCAESPTQAGLIALN